MSKKHEVVIEDERIKLKEEATLIFGFASVGLLGPIINNTLIDQLSDIKQFGFITSKELPPIAVFYDGVLKHPFRLYYSEQYNLIIGACEVPFQSTSAYDGLSETICKWALSNKVKELLTFQGILKKGIIDEHSTYYAAEEAKQEFLEKHNIKKLTRGIIVGPEATFLNRALTNRIEAYALFTEVYEYPTPEGAAAIIEKLNEIYGLVINTEKLIEESKNIKNRMLELAEKAQQYHQKQIRHEDDSERYTQYFQ